VRFAVAHREGVAEGRRRKAKALQRMLSRSLSGKALAVRRVTGNQGKRTPGVDHELWSTPETKSQAVLSFHAAQL
jgi:RNA-directed DNA polymerase